MRSSSRGQAGFTLIEMLMALAITAVLMTAVGVAMQSMITSQAENADIASVTQMSRVVLSRMMNDIRNSEDISMPSSQTLSITPTTNSQGITQMTYTMSAGALYCAQTAAGV